MCCDFSKVLERPVEICNDSGVFVVVASGLKLVQRIARVATKVLRCSGGEGETHVADDDGGAANLQHGRPANGSHNGIQRHGLRGTCSHDSYSLVQLKLYGANTKPRIRVSLR